MKKSRTLERPTLDLLEEAVHLLRSAPLHVFGWYLLGVLPFLLALLYFWTDMSWSAVAFQHRAETSLGVALLFLWMKTCQALFCRKLRAHHARRPVEEDVGWREFVSLAVAQAIVQPSKLFVLPVAALATIPFGWVWAFYENATALGRGESARKFIARSWRQAGFWPRQNHGVIAIYLLLATVVFFDVGIIVFLLPHLLRMFTGVESVFTQSPGSFTNTTSLAVIGGLTYVICDPLLKATYTLRCFHGDSVHSGEDLAVEVRALRLGPVLALVLLLGCLPWPALATPSAAPPPVAASAADLNRAIDQTMKQPRFGWRLPRQAESASASRKWPFVDSIERFFQATWRVVRRMFKTISDWFDKLFSRQSPELEMPETGGWETFSRNWLIVVLILLGGFALVLIAQTVRQFRLRHQPAFLPKTVAAKPDLADENLSADLLPEDEWLALAREHLQKGDVRFALRAFFLAGLAHLATREVLTLARHKSNRDYRAELRRKASDQPPLLTAFEQNIAAVERVWYGRHDIDPLSLEHFESNLEQIRKC